jgi:hypothetical protein
VRRWPSTRHRSDSASSRTSSGSESRHLGVCSRGTWLFALVNFRPSCPSLFREKAVRGSRKGAGRRFTNLRTH